jgi:hypothetical protein
MSERLNSSKRNQVMAFRKSNTTPREEYEGQHRFEHWYRDNQAYFITARRRNQFDAFASVKAQQIFWRQFDKYAQEFGFSPWVVSLMNNHYHNLGYLRTGNNLPIMMPRFHGSVAKLVNDILEVRLVPFWTDGGKKNYFDGCIRDERQGRRAYRYTRLQCVRRGICDHRADYPNTRVYLDLETAIRRALELNAFLEDVRYPRYDGGRQR